MYNYKNLSVLMERIGHKYNQFEKIAHHYYGDIELTHREIHTIACIGDNPGLNLTRLASLQGITKSAASQMISRLRKKELVTKQVSSNSEAEIDIVLTQYGRIAYDEHKKYHENTSNRFLTLLEKVPEDTAKQMEMLLTEFDKAMDDWIKE